MINPWLDFADRELDMLHDSKLSPINSLTHDFVLPEDRKACPNFDQIYQQRLGLQTFLPPQPYVGNPSTATVIVLAANPGFVLRDCPDYKNSLLFVHQSLKSLRFESDWPIHFLDPRLKGTSNSQSYAGYDWCQSAFGDVLDHAATCQGLRGEDAKREIAAKLAIVEWLPYHSNSFSKGEKNPVFRRENELASHRFTRHLVLEAADRGALLVVLWGTGNYNMWKRFVGEDVLKGALRKLDSCAPINAKKLSESCYGKAGFDKIVMRLAS